MKILYLLPFLPLLTIDAQAKAIEESTGETTLFCMPTLAIGETPTCTKVKKSQEQIKTESLPSL